MGQDGVAGQDLAFDPSNPRERWAGQFLTPPMLWDPAVGGNGHYYGILKTEALTWAQAKAEAEALGGYLACIDSVPEDEWIEAELLQDFDDAFVRNSDGFDIGPWIGGIQRPASAEPAGGFRWITGEAVDVPGWLFDQPNNALGIEDAIVFMVDPSLNDLGWSDYPSAPDNVSWQVIPITALIEIEP
ncbi:MAG: hypothetical protein KTR31_34310 [Myxococcales bacterium]|nr:hypothetical protein [Myxococcales bacterium]